jgi:diaminohydroxyphosphoribosylaminopyrimidine deaminase/5-amino-6-(5-phosphoribosylamino)uracil reductase
VAALEDPNPKVAGKGFQMLRAAGIDVVIGVRAADAAELNAGLIGCMVQGRPMVTLKLATSLDGKIATHSGSSQWITGEAAREAAHMLRRQHDAVMVGSGTVLADDPLRPVRMPGLSARAPGRIVVEGRLRTPLTAKLVADAAGGHGSVIFVTLTGADALRLQAYRECGVEILVIDPGADGSLDLVKMMRALAARGLTRILAEGGATLAAALIRADLVDRVAWFRSSSVIGGDGLSAINAFGVDTVEEQARFVPTAMHRFAHDSLETFIRRT